MGAFLGDLGKSKVIVQGMADLKNFKKVSSKIGVAGKAIQAVDAVNDLLKLEDYINRYQKAKTQAEKDKVTKELVELGAKQMQTLTTIAACSSTNVKGFKSIYDQKVRGGDFCWQHGGVRWGIICTIGSSKLGSTAFNLNTQCWVINNGIHEPSVRWA